MGWVWSMRHSLFLPLYGLLATGLACGPKGGRTLPDESDDLEIGSGPRQSPHLAGTQPVGPEIGGSRWRWTEASCTEGTLDLASQGFEQTLEVNADQDGLVFVYDQTFTGDCIETVVQRGTPGPEADSEWSMTEESRVTLGECSTQREPDRPGDVRMRGEFLEVYVQRSRWCNGLEVKMVYAPAPAAPHEGPQILRHYAAHFNRRDARMVTQLFSASGSLVEPFNVTPTGGPSRHDGRDAVYAWYNDAFTNTPWLAMRVTTIEPGATPGAFTMDWEYMDPRLDVPFGARNLFTIAGGEIFETSIEITHQEVPVQSGESSDEAAGEEGADQSDPARRSVRRVGLRGH